MGVRALFEDSTLGAFVEVVEEALGAERRSERIEVSERREQGMEVSFAQQRLWFLAQLEPDSTAYLIMSIKGLEGRVHVEALERSFQQLVQRHESLRTTFAVHQGTPVQIIHAAQALPLPVIDLSGLPESARLDVATRIADQETSLPCDLMAGPLLRVRLLRLHQQNHALLITMHHIISDGWSNEIFVRELTQLYRAYVAGQEPALPPLPIQYADFARWQRQWLQGEVLERQLRFWREHLQEPLPILALPTDRPRTQEISAPGALYRFDLPGELSARIKRLSLSEGTTLFMTLLAAFQVLLHFYSGQDDIIVGTDVANRNRAEIEHLIGFFVNQLVLRARLSKEQTFHELLNQVRSVALDAYLHQDLPFERLVEVLKPDRLLSHTPLFQVKFVFHNLPAGSLALSDVSVTSYRQERRTAKFDLLLNMAEASGQLYGWLEYKQNLFREERIVSMVRLLEFVLEQVTSDTQISLSDLERRLAEYEAEQNRLRESSFMQESLEKLKRKFVR